MDVVDESKESAFMIMVSGDGGSMPIPQPMAGLHESTPAPFLMKTYDMVESSSTNGVVSWSEGRNSFIVWDSHSFASTVLPRYFKHDNFSSFIRQLNTYGFRKVDPMRWEFAHELFLRGQRQLLEHIKRRPINIQHKRRGKSGGAGILTKECNRTALIGEIFKLKQQELKSRNHILQMEMRLRENEKKVEQITSFLEKTLQPKSQHPPPDNNIEEEDAGQVQAVGFDLEAVLTAAIDNDMGIGRLIDNQAKEEMKRIENTLEGLIASDDGILPQGQIDGFYDLDFHLNDWEDGFGTKMPDWNDYMDYVS